jgi:thiol-disulfide isomerase/thioredoxin
MRGRVCNWISATCLVSAAVGAQAQTGVPAGAVGGPGVAVAQAVAEGSAAVAPAALRPMLQGVTETGAPVGLADWRGRVVMVYAWSTGCAVCLDNMAELRRNVAGWAGQPFVLVSVNTDGRRSALDDWHRLRASTLPRTLHWPSLWLGEAGFASDLPLAGQMPAVWVLDKTGAVRYHARGRMPAQAWDQVADLL